VKIPIRSNIARFSRFLTRAVKEKIAAKKFRQKISLSYAILNGMLELFRLTPL
jgi:hypothetical protein